MRVCDLLAQTVKSHGVETMFGVMGDANMYIIDSFERLHGGRYVAAAHEGGAVLMAAGYGAAAGGVGVATVTHGAITNCVSALFDVVRGGYPVVVLAGDTAASDRHNLQNLPQREIVAPTGAAYIAVASAETAADDLAFAFRRALTRREVVVVDLPADFQERETAVGAAAVIPVEGGALAPSEAALEAAAGIAMGSNRPVVLAGRGCTADRSQPLLEELAGMLGAPLCTTLRGKGLFRDTGHNLGVCGTLANPVASEVIARSDCVLAFGASLNALTTMKGELLRGKRVVQFDRDPDAFGRSYPVDLGVLADVDLAVEGLVRLLAEAEVRYTGNRLTEVTKDLATWHDQDRAVRATASGFHIRDAFHAINRIVPSDRFLSIDVGRFGHQALNTVDVESPRHYVHASNIAQIGLSVGYGIGAALAPVPGPALVIAGDGGFMLGGLTEFNTAVRADADLIVFVMNDGGYGAEYYRLAHLDIDPGTAMFDWPDLAEVATALGGTGVTVRSLDDFDDVAKLIVGRSRPILVNVLLDPAEVPDPGIH